MSVLSYWPKEDGFTGMWAGVSALDGTLLYEETDEDEDENIRDRWTYAPIEISREYAQSLELARFDINTFDADPRDGLYPMTANDAFNRSQAEDGETLLDMDVSRVHTARLLQTAQGRSSLRVEDWDGTFLHHAASLVFDQKAVLDTYHAGDGRVYVSCGTMTYTLRRVDEGCWMLSGVDERSGVHTIGPDYASPDGQSIVHRNDGFVYGASPWSGLKTRQCLLPLMKRWPRSWIRAPMRWSAIPTPKTACICARSRTRDRIPMENSITVRRYGCWSAAIHGRRYRSVAAVQ